MIQEFRMRAIIFVMQLAGASLGAMAEPAQHSPYSGLETRSIKALSEQQVADLNAGRGMGLAMAAELNGYPGPSHVLDLADRLGLTPEQRGRTEALFDAMKGEAILIGADVLGREAELDRMFAERIVTEASLQQALTGLAERQAQLRYTHLKYHLAMMAVLSADQIRRYSELRGNAGGHDKHRKG
jgi:Spy/CpxP family protein refolding chaperone